MKVSVFMITYNHEEFIQRAVESVMMQEADFPFELVVGEDCSKDRTRAVVLALQKRFPDKIQLRLNERNLGFQENARRTLAACRGEYVAFLDGDDYWTDPFKLKKQVDYLDVHPECASCFHAARILYTDGSNGPEIAPQNRERSTYRLDDILQANVIPGSSYLLRRLPSGGWPDWVFGQHMVDWALHVLGALHGDIGHIDEVMSVYRMHSSGWWSSRTKDEQCEEIVRFYQVLIDNMDSRYKMRLTTLQQQHVNWLFDFYLGRNKLSKARRYLVRYVLSPRASRRFSSADVIKRFCLALFPALGAIYRRVRKSPETSE